MSCPLQFRYHKFLELPKIENKKMAGKIFFGFMNQYFVERLKGSKFWEVENLNFQGNFDMSEFVTQVTNSSEFVALEDAEKNSLSSNKNEGIT